MSRFTLKALHEVLFSAYLLYGESEGKVKKYGTDDSRRLWRRLHLAIDTDTHEIIAAELALSSVKDADVFPNLLKQTRRIMKEISGDGSYDTRECHWEARVKKALPRNLARLSYNVNRSAFSRYSELP